MSTTSERPMLRLTRRYKFSASHRLFNPELSAEQNRAIYGKCANPFGHGHDYVLEVSVVAPLGEDGRVTDPARLDRLVERAVLRDYSNRNLNLDVPEYAAVVPTSENVALEIERRLAGRWHQEFETKWPALERIRLYETRRNAVEHLAPALPSAARAELEERECLRTA